MKDLYVRVAFPGGNRLYTYRTHEPLNKMDQVVVMAPRGLDIVTVHSMIDVEKVDLNVSFEYKWIVQKIDMTEYNALVFATKMTKANDKFVEASAPDKYRL